MTTLKKGTKKYDYYLAQSKKYVASDLSGAYNSYSYKKRNAENSIKREMEELDGYNYHITSAGCQYFSCCFETKTHIYYHTEGNEFVLEK